MKTTEDRFTPEQIMEVERRTRQAAHNHEYSGTQQQAKRYRETAAILRQAAADDARIAELTDEVARYKHLGIQYLGWLDVKDPEQGIEKDACNPEMFEGSGIIARNALKDGL